jgi:7-cyano-7-deazaguanine reductase
MRALFIRLYSFLLYGFPESKTTCPALPGPRISGIIARIKELERTTMPGYTDREAKAGLGAKLPPLETFPNQFPDYEIVVEFPEFTSVCPKTGLPDFGRITLHYVPVGKVLELKSLKEYFLAYRNLGIFYENVVNRILQDVVRACRPASAVVRGEFNPRGGLSSVIEARYPRPRRRKP